MNFLEWLHNQSNKCLQNEEILNQATVAYTKQSYNRYNTVDGSSSQSGKIFSSQSASEVVEQRMQAQIQHSSSNGSSKTDSSRDSGTSSPQPNEIKFIQLNTVKNTKLSINIEYADNKLSVNGCEDPFTLRGEREGVQRMDDDGDSDSNDSVFSTSSSADEEATMFDDTKITEARDIYLGGSCPLRTKWRQEIAIPYLKSKQISHYLPTLHENLSKKQLHHRKSHHSLDVVLEEESDDETLMYNPNILDSSRVLLFIITDETRSLAPMTLAAHYIGLGYNVVLCVQMLHDGCTIGNDKVSLFYLKKKDKIIKIISFFNYFS